MLVACGGEPGDSAAHRKSPERSDVRTQRVVSLSPLASRFLLAIGAGNQIVGVDEESSLLSGLEERRVVDLRAALRLAPDLLLVGEHFDGAGGIDLAGVAAGTEILEVAPHDLEGVLELCRQVGSRLVGRERADRFEMDLARPLARIGGASFGDLRPRVAAVVGIDPLELAGGHSFETDLIEISGGSSVTHGGDRQRIVVDARRWTELAPDLVLLMTPGELGEAERFAALDAIPPDYEWASFPFDARFFWLDEPVEAARRLRALIRARARVPDSPR